MSEYVRSDIFVGRDKEWDAVHTFIQSDNNYRLLCIHSDSKGGFGKTQLLLRVHDAYKEDKTIVVGHHLIDFYHLDMQRKIGVLEALVKQLDLAESLNCIAAYRQKSILSDDETTIEQLFKKFSDEYHSHISRNNKKKFVFLFDSYEHIQHCTDKGASSTDYSRWLETELIPLLVNECNVRVILAGRYLPAELNIPFGQLEIIPFSEADSTFFLKHAETLGEIGGIAVEEAHELHRLTQGHPILLALAVDWLRHSYDPVRKLLAGVEPGEAFKNRLIKYIRQQLDNDQRFFLSSYITIAYQRLNADILHHLTGEKREDCQKYIKQMEMWSFIKPKGEDSVILHDVMHSLLDEYIKSEDPSFYHENLGLLLGYYDEILFGEEQTLSGTEKEQYILEMVGYNFQLDFQRGLERFCTTFDQAMDDGRYNFARDLLRAAEGWEARREDELGTLDFLKIDARSIEYETESYANHQGALDRADKIIEEYQNDSRWKDSELEGLILLKKGTALFALGRFREAINTFQRAKRILLYSDDGINAHWTTSWTGYTYYQLGDFPHAEKELNKSRKLFYEKAEAELKRIQVWDEDAKKRYRRILQGYQISLVNLALVYLATGRLYEAIRNARFFRHINQNLPRNDREIVRALITLAQTAWPIGYRLAAREYVYDASEKVKLERDPILIARIKTEQLRQHFHESGLLYSSFLEYHRAGDFKEKLKEVQSRKQDKESLSVSDDGFAQSIIEQLEPLGITKELLSAYLVQADVLLLQVPEVSFQRIEKVLNKNMQKDIADDDIQAHEKMQALGNLVRLSYFARAWDMPDAQEVAGKLERYKEQFESELERLSQGNPDKYLVYPELAARYQIISGNLLFDEAIEETSSDKLHKALQHYLTAADLLKTFVLLKDHPFYIIRHRLIVFIRKLVNNTCRDLLGRDNYIKLKEGYICSEDTKEFFELTFNSTLLCLPEASIEELENETGKFYQVVHQDRIGKLNENIIQLKSLTDALAFAAERTNILHEKRVRLLMLQAMLLMKKARCYRKMRAGNVKLPQKACDKAERVIQQLEKELNTKEEENVEILSLKGRLANGRGTIYYRRGSYEEFLESYLKDELESPETRSDLFKRHYQNSFELAEKLLFHGAELLEKAQEKLKNESSDKLYIGELKRLNAWWLGATYFRIGEFCWLNKNFEEAKTYLSKAIDVCDEYGFLSRKLDAMESYVTVVYFDKEDEQELSSVQKCAAFIQEIEENEEEYPVILAKLRVTQGDDIFSRLFQRDGKEKGIYKDVRYSLREKHRDSDGTLPDNVQKSLRKMVIHYIEAAHFMKQSGNERDFVIAVRLLIRRLRMLSDAPVIEKAYTILQEMWDEYPGLQEAKKELKDISEFARVLEGLTKKISTGNA